MTAEPKPENFEDEYEEYDEFDEEENERGLSGLVVLLMGVVMLGAFASVVWIAYQQGIKSGASVASAPPTIAADPDPVKIENEIADAAGAANERSVYDTLDGTPEPAEVLAAGPEEPIDRAPDTTVATGEPGAAAHSENSVVDNAVADRIATLAAADAALETPAASVPAAIQKPPVPAKVEPAPVKAAVPPPAAAAAANALAGSHVVQVGAFKTDAEAQGNWSALQKRLGDYVSGMARDVERADLGEKGVFYRLRIGPFASGAEAKVFCEGLKSRGADCIVRAK